MTNEQTSLVLLILISTQLFLTIVIVLIHSGNLLPMARTVIRFKHGVFDYVFDRFHMVETIKLNELSDFTIDSSNKVYGKRYQGTPYLVLRDIFQRLKHHKEANFIDFGAGKGRAMLMAARHGFKKVVGVEFSIELCEVAKNNLLKQRQCEVINSDVLQYTVPVENSIFFFYNPFTEEVMEKVLENIEMVQNRSKDSIFIYANPICHHVFQRRGYKLLDKIKSPNHNYIVHFYGVLEQSNIEATIPVKTRDSAQMIIARP